MAKRRSYQGFAYPFRFTFGPPEPPESDLERFNREATPAESDEFYRRYAGGSGPITIARGPRETAAEEQAPRSDPPPRSAKSA